MILSSSRNKGSFNNDTGSCAINFSFSNSIVSSDDFNSSRIVVVEVVMVIIVVMVL